MGKSRERIRRCRGRKQSPPLMMDLPGVTVLVVEDERDARELVRHVLKASGAMVTAAGSVSEAMSLLTDVKPRVIISDIGMPDADGYDLIRKVRSLPSATWSRTATTCHS